mmetsp:Transcript_19293/g.53029  ORF Transcript_19293/g.53029 Transcript_19293/m.53029 type:complete len:233 (-) Transcript_19293:8-706(-)
MASKGGAWPPSGSAAATPARSGTWPPSGGAATAPTKSGGWPPSGGAAVTSSSSWLRSATSSISSRAPGISSATCSAVGRSMRPWNAFWNCATCAMSSRTPGCAIFAVSCMSVCTMRSFSVIKVLDFSRAPMIAWSTSMRAFCTSCISRLMASCLRRSISMYSSIVIRPSKTACMSSSASSASGTPSGIATGPPALPKATPALALLGNRGIAWLVVHLLLSALSVSTVAQRTA